MAFLRNAWYVAAWSHELDGGMVSRTICNQPVIVFRKTDGTIAALEDRCPHRFVPLSMGKRIGDTIQCGYHGLRFDSTGACVDAPNDGDAQRDRICVSAYAAIERDSMIWLWLGKPELADPSRIPSFAFLDDIKYASVRGCSYMRANSQLISDNLLDLSHIHYLHPAVHEGSDFSKFTNKVKLEGDEVWSMLWRHNYHLNEQKQQQFGFEVDDVEGQGHSRWNVPGVLLVETAFWKHGSDIEHGIQLPTAHLITPETEFTSFYFWGLARNYRLYDKELSEQTRDITRKIFETEDAPMVEAQQRAMGASTNFLDMKPIILKADAAGVAARRVMKRLMRLEGTDTKPELIAAE